MAYQITETFYEVRQIEETEYHMVLEVYPLTGTPKRVVMQGTFDQCKAWLDEERPGSAISIAE